MSGREGIGVRAWLCWLVAASTPPLVTRNPWCLATALCCIAIVATVTPAPTSFARAASSIFKIVAIVVAISVLFNVLTVRSGDRVIGRLPERLPLLGGAITLNSLVYGLVSALALLTVVTAGLTVVGRIEWTDFARTLPDSVAGIAVAGSIAIGFVPQTVASFHQLREARSVRGAPLRSVRDYLGMAPALLSVGLERAITLAELLETRAFGGRSARVHDDRSPLLLVGGVGSACLAAYAFAVGSMDVVAVTVAAGTMSLVAYHRRRPKGASRSRYRETGWRRPDQLVGAGSLAVILAYGWILAQNPMVLRYEPYPSLHLPEPPLLVMTFTLGLVAPALVYLRSLREGGHAIS